MGLMIVLEAVTTGADVEMKARRMSAGTRRGEMLKRHVPWL